MLGHSPSIGARLIDDENPCGCTRCHIYGIISGSRSGDHQEPWTARNEVCCAFILVWHLVPCRGDAIGMAMCHDRPVFGRWGIEGQAVDEEISFVCEHISNIWSLVIVEPKDTFLTGTGRHWALFLQHVRATLEQAVCQRFAWA